MAKATIIIQGGAIAMIVISGLPGHPESGRDNGLCCKSF